MTNPLKCPEKDAQLFELQKSLVQQQRSARLGECLAMVLHDVANPLSIALLSVRKLVQELTVRNGESPELLRFAQRAAHSLDRMTDIIDFTTAAVRHSRNLKFTVFSVSEILADALVATESKARSENVLLTVLPPGSDDVLSCLPNALVQVLVNLINNGVDAAKTGTAPAWVKVRSAIVDSFVEFRVSNSGARLDSSVFLTLLQPFVTTKPTSRGLGLGLTISKTIVDFHSGEFFLDEHSANTELVFRIPSRLQAQASGSPIKVLVLEDEPHLRDLICITLRESGFIPFPAENPAEALQIFNQEKPRAVLSDIVLGEDTCFAFHEKTQALEDPPSFLFMTGYPEFAAKAFSGVPSDRIMYKPFDLDQAMAKIRQDLAVGQGRDPGVDA